jgi:para-nitrobenzyl esterase
MRLFRFLGTVAIAAPLLACGGGGDEDAPAPAAPSYTASRDTVAVSGGTLAAAADSSASLRVFKAIPYAAPPVGSLRWKPPQPPAVWSGVRRSDSFAPACWNGDRPPGRPGSILYQDTEPQSEDCLYLNVWTGAAAAGTGEKRPVMMLLYGGGYLLGSGAQPNYNGSGLAAKGAVVVTMNYRLGPLGFLAHPELSAEQGGTSGNYALYDAIAALQWIQANIAAFGGDAGNVTVYSESAGAGLASVLLGSPLASGLFHKMMIESLGSMPTTADTPTLAQAQTRGVAYATACGAADLAALRAKLPQDLMACPLAGVGPIVDGTLLPDQLDRRFAAHQFNDVPLMLGWNADEGTPYLPFATTLATYNTAAAAYGALAPQFKAVYPVATDEDVQAMAYAPMRDSTFAWQPWTIARAHAANGSTATYLYHFTRHPPYYPDQVFTLLTGAKEPGSFFGAYHSSEQVYFYNNLDRSAPPRPYDATDRHIADVASSYLVNFARTGDPNAGGLPSWPVFTGPGSQAMIIGDTIGAGPVPSRAALDFYDLFYQQSLGRTLPF